jgi:hypothetical protein
MLAPLPIRLLSLSPCPQSALVAVYAARAGSLDDVAELPVELSTAAAVGLTTQDGHPSLRSVLLDLPPRALSQNPTSAFKAHAEIELGPSLRPLLPARRCPSLKP